MIKKGKNLYNKYEEKINYIILFLLALVICYFFPYTHDDWTWGSSTGVERLQNGFANFDGRWVGNSLAMLLSRFRMLRSLTISLAFVAMILVIKKIVNSENKSIVYLILTLLLLMPIRMFAQAIAWTSGFGNYVIPTIIILWMIYKNKNIFEGKDIDLSNHWIMPFLLIGFIATLFMENLTIYHVILGLFLVGYSVIKTKKLSVPNLFYLLGTIAGSILMFSNSAYRTLFGAGDGYRSIEDSNFILRAINTYFGDFKDLLVNNNFVLNIILSILLLVLSYQFLKKQKKPIVKSKVLLLKIVSLFFSIFMTYQLYMQVSSNTNLFIERGLREIIDGTFVLLFFISFIVIVSITVTDSKRKNRILFELGSIVMISLPLLIVTPIGPRCFFPTYLIFVLLVVELFAIIIEKIKIDFSKILKISTYTLITFLLIFYGYTFMIEQKRVNYMKKHKENAILVLPKIPYEDFMQHPNPRSDWFKTQYKKYYGLDSNTELEFIEYKKWKREYKE